MCNDRQESMEGLLPFNSWVGGGGHGASGLAIVRAHHRLVLLPSWVQRPLALFQICICIFFAARCSSADESQLVAVHSPSPPSRSLGSPPPQVGRRCRRPSGIKGPAECLGRYLPPIQIPMPSHFAIPRANPEVFEESSGQAREVREGRPLVSPAPGPAARFQLCSALSLARRQPALLAGSSLQPVFGWPPASSLDQDSRGSRRLDSRKPCAPTSIRSIERGRRAPWIVQTPSRKARCTVMHVPPNWTAVASPSSQGGTLTPSSSVSLVSRHGSLCGILAALHMNGVVNSPASGQLDRHGELEPALGRRAQAHGLFDF